jgi:hypothetical protein
MIATVTANVRVVPPIIVLLDGLEPAHIVVRMGNNVDIENVLLVICSKFGSEQLA